MSESSGWRPPTGMPISSQLVGAGRALCDALPRSSAAARGRSYPVDAFREAFAPWLQADAPEIDKMTWEGTGCWNPIFPARADDVTAHAALAAKQLDMLLDEPLAEPELRVFERAADGT